MKPVIIMLIACLLISCNEFYRKDPPEERSWCGTCVKEVANGKDAIFSANCASCHHPFKDAAGPALKGVFETRSVDWVFKFLTKRKYKPQDNKAKDLIAKYGRSCMKFQLTRTEVDSLYNYIKRFK